MDTITIKVDPSERVILQPSMMLSTQLRLSMTIYL